ncbi:AAA family ATPase [Tissierella sp.]|uniref:AAA family ATPase n=1 Tax=Tissierella sp. TaxID=41274 RepID=UPI00285F52C8|nr:AAA family ATPase [Tissierella sp.]MDR7856819.1 AAA family ATPase [Tissierella sp.]
MILKEISIHNYRKYVDTTFTLDNDVTLLAGANNSGKTSLIDLLCSVIGSNRVSYSVSDIPVILAKAWCDKIYPIICGYFDAQLDKEKTISEIVEAIFQTGEESGIPEMLVPPTQVRFRIDYSTTDDIRNFADYIMDFDSEKRSFYFVYTFKPTAKSLEVSLEKDYDKLKSRYSKITNPDTEIDKIELLKEKILCTYATSIVESCLFTDSTYENAHNLEPSDFRKLFNFKNIYAGRPLDDQSIGKTRNLSKNMIDLACHDEDWKVLIGELPDKILQPIEDLDITKIVRKASIEGLSEAIEEVSKSNGGNSGEMVLDLDISEEAISTLINQITNAKYQFDGYLLSEASQGLGYSNMVYILLQLETYKRNINPLLVNIFIIEEPESHMHPQMQSIFAKYLRKYYQQKKIQGIITTHSSEMVRATDMKNLRVARPSGSFDSKVYDFSAFKERVKGDDVLSDFYDWFYEIGFSDIVFADRVILYEGDTERLLIRKLGTFDCYQALNQLYIAFVQVGGAYAHNYRELIEFLKVKTLILTDLDYEKTAVVEDAVKSSKTTNASLNSFYKISHPGIDPTVENLYNWEEARENILFDGCAFVAFQGKNDNFARTLEEAMLAKKYGIKSFDKKAKSDWIELRANDKLKYTIPRDYSECCIRDIVAHTSNSKTDFMYSVILNKLVEDMLPDYIKGGLIWLME